MKSPARISLFVLLLAALVLAACGGAPAATEAPAAPEMVMPAATAAPFLAAEPAAQDQSKAAGEAAVAVNVNAMPGQGVVVQTGADALTSAQSGSRMIIKNAEVRLLVEETDNAIDRSIQVIGDVNGYIISSRVWYQPGPDGQNYKYATISLGVPVEQFENAMRRFRNIALQVLDENASGQDVSDEYVDLQSELTNLEATRDRIRGFLDDAKTIDESLRINQELATIESQIEQVKGRMSYLANRSAFSTITLTLEPEIPPVTPAPTFTPTPTPTPKPWNPGDTVGKAGKSVVSIYQVLIELAIWFFMVIVPLFAPPALILWGIVRLLGRRKNKPAAGG